MPVEVNEGAAAPRPVVGIIYPPPEVRNIVDKTAGFVARNGPEFESRIRQNEQNNAKFNFLTPGDAYHAYYQHKVKECREGRGGAEITIASTPKTSFSALVSSTTSQQQASLLQELTAPKEAPPEFDFMANPPSISANDLDIVRLTAQFVARNGRQFLTSLAAKEQFNYQFDFLRPQHSLFHYFTKLVEQYTKVLLAPKDVTEALQRETKDKTSILHKVSRRVDWNKHQQRQQQQRDEEQDKERAAFAAIDWHDFVVVETINFREDETGDLPPPITPQQVGSRVIAEQRHKEMQAKGIDVAAFEAASGDAAMDDDDDDQENERRQVAQAEDRDEMAMDMDEDEDEDDSAMDTSVEKAAETAATEVPAGVQVVQGYNPKTKKLVAPIKPSTEFLISPLTGERIPAEKMQEHMRYGLLDPRWKEQRDKQEDAKRNQEEALGGTIEENLKKIAERRTDIFGVGGEEAQIGQKIGEEEDPAAAKKVTWDGHSGTRDMVRENARKEVSKMSLEDQISQMQKARGILPREEAERIGPHPGPPPRQSPAPRPSPPARPPMQQASATSAPPLRPPAGSIRTVAPPPPMHSTSSMTGAVRPPAPPAMPLIRPPGPPPMGMPPPQLGARPPPPMGARPPLMQPPMPPMQGGPPQPPPGARPPPPMRPPGMPGPPPGMPGPPPGMPGPPQTAPPVAAPGPMSAADEPLSKRRPDAEDHLMLEEQFVAQHPGPVTFKVVVPNSSEKAEWQLNGQMVSITLPITDPVSVIKAKLHEEVGLPAGKQKLVMGPIFVKDSNSLGYYNVTPATVMQLHLKERGGRKK